MGDVDKPDKKILINNFKINLFSKNKNELYNIISEFIFIFQVQYFLENILIFLLEYFVNTNYLLFYKFQNCINFINTNNKKELFLNNKVVYLYDLIEELFKLNKNNKISEFYYKKNKEVKLEYETEIILKTFHNIHYKLYNYIINYIPNELHKYFCELLFYYFTQNKLKFFNLLNTIINKFSKNKKLIKYVETTNSDFKDNLIILLFHITKIINILIYEKNKLFEEYYNIIENIFYWNLKKNNIYSRINLLFILFEILFDLQNVILNNKENLIIINNIESDIDYKLEYNKITDINKLKLINLIKTNLNYNLIFENHLKLINLYNIKIKKQVKKNLSKNKINSMDNSNSNNFLKKNTNSSTNNNKDILELTEYLFTIININKDKYIDKHNKINKNRFLLNQTCSKNININCNDTLFNSINNNNNNFNIIKLDHLYK